MCTAQNDAYSFYLPDDVEDNKQRSLAILGRILNNDYSDLEPQSVVTDDFKDMIDGCFAEARIAKNMENHEIAEVEEYDNTDELVEAGVLMPVSPSKQYQLAVPTEITEEIIVNKNRFGKFQAKITEDMRCSPKIRNMGATEMFLELTRHTCPYGMETEMYGKALATFGFKTDKYGNYYKQIGDKPYAMFCGHLDTVGQFTAVKREYDTVRNEVFTDNKSILGADDKAGVTVILQMMQKKVQGLYYLFVGEEVGCIGSKDVAKTWLWPTVKLAIEFDRRGKGSIITHQMGERSASNEFATQLASMAASYKLSLYPDDTGSFTDTSEFVDIIPECTNISIGYENAHSSSEMQDMTHLVNVVNMACSIDWGKIEYHRDPSKREVRGHYRGYSQSYHDWNENSWDTGKFNSGYAKNNKTSYSPATKAKPGELAGTDRMLHVIAQIDLVVRSNATDGFKRLEVKRYIRELIQDYPYLMSEMISSVLIRYPDIMLDYFYEML